MENLSTFDEVVRKSCSSIILGPGTDLIHSATCLVLVLLIVEATRLSSKKAKGSVVSNRIGMKFDSNVFQVNTHRLAE